MFLIKGASTLLLPSANCLKRQGCNECQNRFFAHFHHQINQISGLWSAVAKTCHPVLQAEVVIFKQIGTMENSGVQKARVGFVSASLFGFLDLAKSAHCFLTPF